MSIAVFLQEDETGATEDETRGLGPCGPHLEGVRSARTPGPQAEKKRSQQVCTSLLIILPRRAEDGSSRQGWQKAPVPRNSLSSSAGKAQQMAKCSRAAAGELSVRAF